MCEKNCVQGVSKREEEEPSWTSEHELGTCWAPRARKPLAAGGNMGRRHSLGQHKAAGLTGCTAAAQGLSLGVCTESLPLP